MPVFSSKSKKLLLECDIRLQEICNQAIEVMDFSVITGYRSRAEQGTAFLTGASKVAYPDSKHNLLPSLAIDIAPFPIDWSDNLRFTLLAGVMFGTADICGVKLRWGGDWDGDFNLKENKFLDLGHFEIKD